MFVHQVVVISPKNAACLNASFLNPTETINCIVIYFRDAILVFNLTIQTYWSVKR